MQSFKGKINFVRISFVDFVEIVKPLQWMIKKDMQFNSTSIEKEAFKNIKVSIVVSPMPLIILLQQCSLKNTNKGMSSPSHS